MVTGDNAQCGHFIAKECVMVAAHAQVFLGDCDDQNWSTSSKPCYMYIRMAMQIFFFLMNLLVNSVLWLPMNGDQASVSKSLTTEELLQQHLKGLSSGVVELAVTGKAFNILRRTETIADLLFFIRIYARFTPEDKVAYITIL
jgi:cation-transporting ATPase 13A3/4/5